MIILEYLIHTEDPGDTGVLYYSGSLILNRF